MAPLRKINPKVRASPQAKAVTLTNKPAGDGAASIDTPGWQAFADGWKAQHPEYYGGQKIDPNKAMFNSLLGDATNTANTGYGHSIADSYGNEATFASDLGANLTPRDPNADPSAVTQGSIDWGHVQASNPFSKAALLVRSFGEQQNRTTNGYAARGQLYSGAIQNQRGNDTFGYQQGQDTLNKGLLRYLTGQSTGRRDAGVTRDTTINNGGFDALKTLLGG